ncbi:REP-associated tyrosine transposase [Phytopseudomonas dryadis]|uniref:REP-associated tyrosine transposase n=1 Tax=Phytopseudomonas dryadis TaxID=2487520 RepID=UPI001F61C83F|nr:transposase [Pseudomonas dryadis]
MRYRRTWVPGGTYFFTVNLADRSQNLLTERIDLLRNALREVRKGHPFGIPAMVVLPDHLHCIWRLPEGDCAYATRWALIKSTFSRQLQSTEPISLSRHLKRERAIWQRRYKEHCIHDQDDLQRHIDYIHFNPVRHGYVTHPGDWPYSSLHRHIGQGLVPADWTGEIMESQPGLNAEQSRNRPFAIVGRLDE